MGNGVSLVTCEGQPVCWVASLYDKTILLHQPLVAIPAAVQACWVNINAERLKSVTAALAPARMNDAAILYRLTLMAT